MSDAENNSPAAKEEKVDMNEHNEDTTPDKEQKEDVDKEVKEDEEMKEVEVEEKVQTPKKVETPRKSPQKPAREESEEEMEDDDDDDDESDTPKLGLLEQPVVIESGKRAKRKVERLDMSATTTPKEKKKLIPEGSGEKLGDSPRIEYMLQKTKADDLKLLHKILFNRLPENVMATRRNIRQFCGFDFSKGDKDYERKLTMVNKCNMSMLKPVCELLDIERGGKKEEIVERLMEFLLSPKDSGRKVPQKKTKKKSIGKKSTPRVKKDKKKETKKKAKAVSESSEEEEEEKESEDEEEKEEKESEDEEQKESEDEEEKESEEEPSEEESEEEVPKKKTQKKPVKKENATKKKENGKKPTKKEKLPKVKSSPKKRKASDDSSDDEDEPLAKKKKSDPPSNEELKDVIKKILEGANLEEITMKTVVKQVYGKYPQFDLADRKDFIKNTVKLIIS